MAIGSDGIDRGVGFEALDYVAFALGVLMTLGPLAAGMLFWPIHT